MPDDGHRRLCSSGVVAAHLHQNKHEFVAITPSTLKLVEIF